MPASRRAAVARTGSDSSTSPGSKPPNMEMASDGHVAEGGDRLAVRRVDVGEEVVEAVGRGVGVGRHHDVVAPASRLSAAVVALTHVTASLPPESLVSAPHTTAGAPGRGPDAATR